MSDTAPTAAPQSTDVGAGPSVEDDGTVRDRVWDATLDLVSRRPLPFQAWRIRKRAKLDDENDRTIRRTLSVMADAGWLVHEDNSKWWYPGPKAKERFDEYD
ncbi:hypothetical protein G9464_20835 [Halostella sp. JP-L12]|uniref:hypothetical protein n=1 Tax=Halostella TaxID=1843185 RepID=UPI0013CEBB89|nr:MULTISPECIES: hypothetical protein [Halostella]NHN50018.1 hypothetical protein [Halostella sp. JP-L12]